MGATRRQLRFDPDAHARELAPLVAAIAAQPPIDARELDRLVRQYPKCGRGLFRKSEIIAGFRALGGVQRFGASERDFVARMRPRPVRTLSGVTPVTVLSGSLDRQGMAYVTAPVWERYGWVGRRAAESILRGL